MKLKKKKGSIITLIRIYKSTHLLGTHYITNNRVLIDLFLASSMTHSDFQSKIDNEEIGR